MEQLLIILDEIDKFIQKLYEPLDRKMEEDQKTLREGLKRLNQELAQIETQLEHLKEGLSSAQIEMTRHSVEFKEEGCEDRAEMHPICPNCKEYLDNEKWGFCPYCGIPIKWED